MLNLVRVALLAAALWSGYWAVAGFGLRGSVTGWFSVQAERGWQAEYSDIRLSGFPFRHRITIDAPALADPSTGTAWRADRLALESPAIWPGRQTLHFPETAQRLSYYDHTLVIEAEAMRADLNLAPGNALTLQSMALTSGEWSVSRGAEVLADADALSLSMVQQDAPEHYRIHAEAPDFSPGKDMRRLLGGSEQLPRSFDRLELDLNVAFDKPWDRSALEQSRPQPRVIDLKLAEAVWGELRLFAAGKVTVDEYGVPTGEVALKAENWREMVNMAQQSGALPARAAEPLTRVLNMLAGLGGNPEALDLELGFRGGYVTLGPIPLGPAPRLFLR
ncbi:DUF2125 domain-containing protein [Ruegeria marina]|uniref:DUF2125 domain-containing protein n=1 Tax=Ruegeria marina TaxID=639004 RepID=A0A1G6QXN6_9RHOB|nr:DUF2125 domain-containing protein [Ruegeria marina]SDC97229.1 hypothetical protein SAMN04488239_104269 [Ruegeria marina]